MADQGLAGVHTLKDALARKQTREGSGRVLLFTGPALQNGCSAQPMPRLQISTLMNKFSPCWPIGGNPL